MKILCRVIADHNRLQCGNWSTRQPRHNRNDRILYITIRLRIRRDLYFYLSTLYELWLLFRPLRQTEKELPKSSARQKCPEQIQLLPDNYLCKFLFLFPSALSQFFGGKSSAFGAKLTIIFDFFLQYVHGKSLVPCMSKLAGNNQLSAVSLFRYSGFLPPDWRYPFLRNSGTPSQEYSE